jgi:methylmalonyl-CoA/ethylmalonyl-CoA epimerase
MHDWVFDHVGMLVHDIQGARAALAPLGYDAISDCFVDERQGILIQFVWRASDTAAPKLELVQPMRENSVVSNLLVKTGATPYHLCFRVAALGPALEHLHAQGFLVLGTPAPSAAFGGAQFCFLYHRDLGLVELVDAPVRLE